MFVLNKINTSIFLYHAPFLHTCISLSLVCSGVLWQMSPSYSVRGFLAEGSLVRSAFLSFLATTMNKIISRSKPHRSFTLPFGILWYDYFLALWLLQTADRSKSTVWPPAWPGIMLLSLPALFHPLLPMNIPDRKNSPKPDTKFHQSPFTSCHPIEAEKGHVRLRPDWPNNQHKKTRFVFTNPVKGGQSVRKDEKSRRL